MQLPPSDCYTMAGNLPAHPIFRIPIKVAPLRDHAVSAPAGSEHVVVLDNSETPTQQKEHEIVVKINGMT